MDAGSKRLCRIRSGSGEADLDLSSFRLQIGVLGGEEDKGEAQSAPVADEVLELQDIDPETFMPKSGGEVIRESITAAVRADREGRR